MKKIALFFVGICGLATVVSAQTFTNTRLLNESAARLKISSAANYAKAVAMASKKGWKLTFRTKDGNRATLVGVDDFGFPKYYITANNAIAAATTRANQLWPGGSTGLNLSGSTAALKNKMAVWDGGIVLGTHVELAGRITQKDAPKESSDHATHVTGTMIASGVNPSAKGMAYGSPGIIAYDYENDAAEMTFEAANLLLSNHSYGTIAGWRYNTEDSRWEYWGLPDSVEDYKFGFYDRDAANFDEIAYNAPFFLIVKSSGNTRTENGPAVGTPYFRQNASGQFVNAGNRPDGISSNNSYDGVSMEGTAKNILTVGAVAGLPSGYTRKEDVVLGNFSSWGPTDDGRIKPDVVADGVNVLSSTNTSNTAYATFSGTSMATPNVTGSLMLVQEYYSKLKNGAFLRSASLKGLAIHTAEEAGPSDGPDYQFGWGLLNVEKAAAVLTTAVGSNNALTSSSLLYENTLAQGASFTTTVVASGKGKLQATICWTDVKGPVEATNVLNSRTKRLVNDLDIRVTKGARTYLPWTLNVASPASAAVRGDNNTDNVERIDIDSTVPGQTYTITVTHKGTLVTAPQAYSLIIGGVGGTAYCASASGGGGARIDNVTFKDINVTNSTGSKTYTDNTGFIANIEPGQTSPIAIRVNTADATTASRMVKVFIDYNNNGVFDLPGELAATSGVLTSASQVYTGSVTVPSTVTVGSMGLMRIIVQETTNAADINSCGTYGKGETQDFTFRVGNPSNDVAITDITAPTSNDCGTGIQYLTLNLRNNGSVAQSIIPINVSIATGGTVVGNLSFTHPGPIAPLTTIPYTFQVPFATNGGTTYTITATVNLANDQFSTNNTLVSGVTTAPKPASPTAVGSNCGLSSVTLKITNVDPDATYFWYTSATGTSPFATGSTVTSTTPTANNTYYVARGAKVSVGPANKQAFTSGGYNIFRGNFVRINNTVPVVIQTVRLYVGYPGTVRVTLANLLSEDANGNVSYQPLASRTIDVYATTPNVVAGAVTGNNAADTGAIFRLDLPVSTVGDHILMLDCSASQGRSDSATVFRNNLITSTTTYPMAIPNVFSITGNSGSPQSSFYYFFYDMKVATLDCVSDRIAVTATVPSFTISQVGDSLVSNTAATAIQQWFKDGTAIPGANSNHYKPAASGGNYYLLVTDAFGCQTKSNTIPFVITAAIDVTAREIKLLVSPNPSTGTFNLSFEVTTKADLSIEIMSANGQRVYNAKHADFVGRFSRQITLGELSSEFYLLKITHDKKTYLQKLLIQR